MTASERNTTKDWFVGLLPILVADLIVFAWGIPR